MDTRTDIEGALDEGRDAGIVEAFSRAIEHAVVAVDREHRTLDITQVHDHARAQDLLCWLETTHALDLREVDPTTAATMHDTIGRVANAIDDRRTFGVEHEGYHLVIAYCVEARQHHLAA